MDWRGDSLEIRCGGLRKGDTFGEFERMDLLFLWLFFFATFGSLRGYRAFRGERKQSKFGGIIANFQGETSLPFALGSMGEYMANPMS